MKKLLLLFILLPFIGNIFAQHTLETLDRGLVAMKTSQGVFISWRIPGEEWYNVGYNVYRDGSKLNDTPLKVSNYSDSEGTLSSFYTVSAVVNGTEQGISEAVAVWSSNFKEVTLDIPAEGVTPSNNTYTYSPNDLSVGDVTGDGSYEFFVKWNPSNAHDNSQAGYTGNVFIDAYTQNSNRLWRIDLGVNIRAGAHYTQFLVYDFDGDGKVELVCKTAPGTKDGLGNYLSNGPASNDYDASDYRNSSGYILSGAEYLTVFNGETGAEMATVNYTPQRGNVGDWGDEYGNRVDRFLAGVAYLDGVHPSVVMTRGYYAKTVLAAWDWDGVNLTQRWVFDSTSDGNSDYHGQGNHSLAVADVDEDGKDEIVFGSCTIDDDGTGLYSTKMGHGDANHITDLDPYRKGQEAFRCLEHSPHWGVIYHDAANGDVLIHQTTGYDCGRCIAGNISNKYPGAEMAGGGYTYSASTVDAISDSDFKLSTNFRTYWDGDLLDELLDGTAIAKENYNNPVFNASGVSSNNGTKSTPNISADLFGDWREEVVFRTTDNTKLRIYTTTYPTIYRNYTLMHDRQYRLGIAWQNVGYNQPPHKSYFLGEAEGITVPPPPAMRNGRLVFAGTATWDKTSNDWTKDGVSTTYTDGGHVYFDELEGNVNTIVLSDNVSPSVLSVNSPGDYTLNTSNAKLTGDMQLVKYGKGTFTLVGDNDFTGTTEIWNGTLNIDGDLSQSPVWVNLFGEVASHGRLGKGMYMRYGSHLYVGGKDEAGTLTIADSLVVEENSELVFDINSLTGNNDTLHISGDLSLANGSIIRIIPHFSDEDITPGTYTLATYTGELEATISQVNIEGLDGISASLQISDDNLIQLVVDAMREATTVYWNGNASANWDLLYSKNFLNAGVEDFFATNDDVIFNDDATTQNITITEGVQPSSMTFDNSTGYTISGAGTISGAATLTKKGSGMLSITNKNDFSGKVLIEEGELRVNTMPNSIDGIGAIGNISDNAELFVINGGVLNVAGETSSEQAVNIGSNNGTIKTDYIVTWLSRISGSSLRKTGSGTLNLEMANNNSETIIEDGTIALSSESALPGKKVIFKGGTLQCYDSGGSYSTSSFPLYVAEGETGTIRLDGRCTHSNSLTGAGILNVHIPWIRSDLKGNWSAFTGTININEGAWFRNYESYGYPNAIFNLPENASMTAMDGQALKFGTLTGGGNIGGASSIELGMRDEDFTFEGNLESGNIIKKGSGTLTSTELWSTNGNLTIQEGGVIAKDSIGTKLSGSVYVYDGAWLASNSVISKHLTIKSGGKLYAGLGPFFTSAGATITIASVTMENNSIYSTKTNPKRSNCDNVEAASYFKANGTLELSIARIGEYAEGQSYQIVNSPNITGTFSSISPATPGEGLAWDLSEFNTTGNIKVVSVSAIKDQVYNALNIYPNPSNGLFTVENTQNYTQLSVLSLDGKELLCKQYEAGLSAFNIDLRSETPGIYIIKLISTNDIKLGRIVIK